MSNIPDKLGRTPLLLALMSCAKKEAIEMLLQEGESVDIADYVGRSSLEAAILYCSIDVIKVILQACVNSKTMNFDKVRTSVYSIKNF